MSNEETVRYWGEVEAERQDAFKKDAAERTAKGWRVTAQRTQFAFGKPGMDLVVTYVSDGADPGTPPPPPAHFDLNAAVARATTSAATAPAVATPIPLAPEPPTDYSAPADVPEAEEPQPEEREPEEAAADESEDVVEDSALPAAGPEAALTPEQAQRLFGPSSDDVLWVLDSLAEIDRATAEEISAAFARSDEAAHAEAIKALTGEFGGPPFGHRMKAAEDRVRAWVDSIGAQGNDRALYEAVGSAAMDAVDALVVQDQLVEDTFNVLYGPWGSVMDEPEPDEPDEPDDANDADGADGADADAALVDADAEDDAEFGPNTDLVLEFFSALRDMTVAQIDQLVQGVTGEWQATLRASRDRAEKVESEKDRWIEQCDAAIHEIEAWVAYRKGAHFNYRSGETSELDREAAEPAVVDAVTALIMADLLERTDRENLYLGWSSAVGTPALPVYADDTDETGETDESDDDADEADDEADEADAPAEDEGELGPTTDVVLAFFSKLTSLTGRQLAQLGDPTPNDGRGVQKPFDHAMKLATEKREWRLQLEAVVREVMFWRDRSLGLHFDYSTGAGQSNEREQARTAVLRAAVALLFADLLDSNDAKRLYATWARVVGEPELPEYSDG